MARLFADYSFDISSLNLNRLVTGYYDSQFVNNEYVTIGDYTYEDLLEIIYYSGSYLTSLFGGKGFTINNSGDLTAGTVTGYLASFYSGTTPVASWGIVNFTYSAAKMYKAALTSSTSDDYSIISSILSGNDSFYLSSYADKVNGYAGNDSFYPGAGKDTLTGGSGADKFIFDTALNASTNLDTIKDFALKSDKIVLDDDIFTKFANKSSIAAGNLITGTKALQADDYLIYNTSNDTLYYDQDGSGSKFGLVAFAKIELTGSAAPSATDFQVIA